jgi:excisionase family DNA binding protein
MRDTSRTTNSNHPKGYEPMTHLDDLAADEKLFMPAEVADLFRVDPKTVTRWAKAGKLTSIRTLGGHRRYRASDVRALLRPSPQATRTDIEITVAHVSSSDPKGQRTNPVAVAIREHLPEGWDVKTSGATVIYSRNNRTQYTVPLPGHVHTFLVTLRSGHPAPLPKFTIELPAAVAA